MRLSLSTVCDRADDVCGRARPVTGFTSPRDHAFERKPTPRGGHQGHHTSHTHTTHTREVAELETPREEDFQPTYEVTEVPMEAVSRSSRADGGLSRKEKNKGRRGGGHKAPPQPPQPPPPVPPPAFDRSELPGVRGTFDPVTRQQPALVGRERFEISYFVYDGARRNIDTANLPCLRENTLTRQTTLEKLAFEHVPRVPPQPLLSTCSVSFHALKGRAARARRLGPKLT